MDISKLLFITIIWYAIGLATLTVVIWKDFDRIVLNKSLFCLSAFFGPILTVFFIFDKVLEYLKNRKKK